MEYPIISWGQLGWLASPAGKHTWLVLATLWRNVVTSSDISWSAPAVCKPEANRTSWIYWQFDAWEMRIPYLSTSSAMIEAIWTATMRLLVSHSWRSPVSCCISIKTKRSSTLKIVVYCQHHRFRSVDSDLIDKAIFNCYFHLFLFPNPQKCLPDALLSTTVYVFSSPKIMDNDTNRPSATATMDHITRQLPHIARTAGRLYVANVAQRFAKRDPTSS